MIIVLLCQGLIFETSDDDTINNAVFLFFGTLMSILVVGTLSVSVARGLYRTFKKDFPVLIPRKAFELLSEDASKELMQFMIDLKMEKFDAVEFSSPVLSKYLKNQDVLNEIYSAVDGAENLTSDALARFKEKELISRTTDAQHQTTTAVAVSTELGESGRISHL
jgi:hypothetical protein